MKRVLVTGGFDDLRFADFRFLEEAAKLGDRLEVVLQTDGQIIAATGKPPKFPLVEREYFVSAIRCVSALRDAAKLDGDIWAVRETDDTAVNRGLARSRGLEFRVIEEATLKLAPPSPAVPVEPPGTRVVVTGSFDWFHSGHVRFFEECAELGDLYCVVGHDANIRLLKGQGHPLFPDRQRRYIAGAIRFVKLALISTGQGWMDGEPEFLRIKPHIYAVNEDGDKPEKLAFCQKHGIEYRVLKLVPKDGLPKRQSTNLRGF